MNKQHEENALKRDKAIQGLTKALQHKDKDVSYYRYYPILLTIYISACGCTFVVFNNWCHTFKRWLIFEGHAVPGGIFGSINYNIIIDTCVVILTTFLTMMIYTNLLKSRSKVIVRNSTTIIVYMYTISLFTNVKYY